MPQTWKTIREMLNLWYYLIKWIKNQEYDQLKFGFLLITSLKTQYFQQRSFLFYSLLLGRNVSIFFSYILLLLLFIFFILRVMWSSYYFRKTNPLSERWKDRRRNWRRDLDWGQMPSPDKLREDWRVRSVGPGAGEARKALLWQRCVWLMQMDGVGGEEGVARVEMPLGHPGKVLRQLSWRAWHLWRVWVLFPEADLTFPLSP